MSYIEDFQNALTNKKSNVESTLVKNISSELSSNLKLDIPASLVLFYKKISYLKVEKEGRFMEVLPLDKLYFIQSGYLVFSYINEREICFATDSINEAKEWDIVDGSSKYLITKTISSYITNKLWAWVLRGRSIWRAEWESL